MPSDFDSLVDEFVTGLIGTIGVRLSDAGHEFMSPKACSPTRAAKVYGIGPKRLMDAIAAGELATYCDGKVLLADVDAWFHSKRDARKPRVRLVG